jgi:hypothetical protein
MLVKAWRLRPRESKWPRFARPSCAASGHVWPCLGALLFAFPVLSQTLPSAPAPTSQTPGTTNSTAVTTKTETIALVCASSEQSDQHTSATLRGTVADSAGTAVAGAVVSLTHDDQTPAQPTSVAEDGQFAFTELAPGPYRLVIASPGFTTLAATGTLSPGQTCDLPRITLVVATNYTEVHVQLSTVEIAQQQIEDQEKQRLLGVIPNFYVTYAQHPVPLTPKQKFELAWKSTIDPVSFGVTAATAGIEQATNTFSGYGQGASGYGKRFGAAYGGLVTSTYIGGAILPSLLKQDPRYYYKGSGSVRSRVLYAMANAVICKGDNGHWQPNYSGIMGSLASGGISNLYYPSTDRNDAAVTFENTLIGIGETAAVNILQEFVLRKLTPNVPSSEPAHP